MQLRKQLTCRGWGPVKGTVSAQKALLGSNTKISELLEGTVEKSTSPFRGHWFSLITNKLFFTNMSPPPQKNWLPAPSSLAQRKRQIIKMMRPLGSTYHLRLLAPQIRPDEEVTSFKRCVRMISMLNILWSVWIRQRLLHLYLDDDVSKISKFRLSHQSDFQTLITQKWHKISISFFDILKI